MNRSILAAPRANHRLPALIALICLFVAVSIAGAPRASAATNFEVFGVPTPFEAGSSSGISVRAYNEDGSVDTGYRGTIHFTSTDPEATLPPDYTFTAGDNGDHDFPTSSVILRTAGEQIVTATDVSDGSITGSQTEISVVEPEAADIEVFGIRDPITLGVTAEVIVRVYTQTGRVFTGFRGSVHFSSTDPDATLPADYTFTAGDNGTHTFTNGVRFATIGEQVVTVTLTSNPDVFGQQTEITVRDRAPSSLTARGVKTNAGIKATGKLTPAHPGVRIAVSLIRGTRTLKTKRPVSNASGAFTILFTKPSTDGFCKVKAVFAGDDDHRPSQKTSARFAC